MNIFPARPWCVVRYFQFGECIYLHEMVGFLHKRAFIMSALPNEEYDSSDFHCFRRFILDGLIEQWTGDGMRQ